MALVVDRFEYLAREIISTLTSARDVLAVVGTLYAARKSLSVLCRLLTTLKTYGVGPSWFPDLRQRYGEWAGWWAWHVVHSNSPKKSIRIDSSNSIRELGRVWIFGKYASSASGPTVS